MLLSRVLLSLQRTNGAATTAAYLSSRYSQRFTKIVDMIANRNPQVNTSGFSQRINWHAVKDIRSIEVVQKKYNIPSIFDMPHNFQNQMYLYTTLVRVIRGFDGEVKQLNLSQLRQLHESALLNIAAIKGSALLKTDLAFNSFCASLFEGTAILSRLSPDQKVTSPHKSTIIIEALTSESFETGIFWQKIFPLLTNEQAIECCNLIFESGKGDLLIRLIQSQSSDSNLRKSLEEKYMLKIRAEWLTHSVNQIAYFSYHNKLLKIDSVSSEQISIISTNLQASAECFLLSTKLSSNLFIKFIEEFLQQTTFTLTIDTIQRLADRLHKGSTKEENKITSLRIIEGLEKLNFEKSDIKIIHSLLGETKNKLLELKFRNASNDDSSNAVRSHKELTTNQLTRLCIVFNALSPEKIPSHPNFSLLTSALELSVNTVYTLNILTSSLKANKELAKLLQIHAEKKVKEFKKIIEESITYLPNMAFSQVIFLTQQRILPVSNNFICEKIKSQFATFTSILLVQSYYYLLSTKTNDEGLCTLLRSHIFSIEEQLTFEDLNLLLRSIQFEGNHERVIQLQEFIEKLAKANMLTETRFANLHFILTYHKIIKDGVQTNYVASQIQQLQTLFSSPAFNVAQTDLFHFSQLILALSKFDTPKIIFEVFLDRARLVDFTKPIRNDQLVFVHVATLKAATIAEKNAVEILAQCEEAIYRQLPRNTIPLVQIVKVMHEMLYIYPHLEETQREFFQVLLKHCVPKLGQDIGLDIWVFWQQAILGDNADLFKKLYLRIESSISCVIDHIEAQNYSGQENRRKQYKLDMKSTVKEISIIQLTSAIQFFEVNKTLGNHQLDDELKGKLSVLKERIFNSVYIQSYSTSKTTRYVSIFESEIRKRLNILLQEEKFIGLQMVFEKKLQAIYFVDIFIPELNLAIECNGNQHYLNKHSLHNEEVRIRYLESKGIKFEIISSALWSQKSEELRDFALREILTKHIIKKSTTITC